MGKVLKTILIVAAVFVISVATFGVGGAGIMGSLTAVTGSFFAATLGIGLSMTAASLIGGILVGGVLAGLSALSSKKTPEMPSLKGSGLASNFIQPMASVPIVYGRCQVGGPVIFYHARQSGDDEFRYLIIAVAGHEIDAFETFYLNEEAVTISSNLVTSGTYANAAWIWAQTGTLTDTPPSVFTSETDSHWSADHRGKGIAKIYIKFKLTETVIQNGVPKVIATIRGRNDVYDPRTLTSGYTNNGILCLYNWMLTARSEGGYGLSSDQIDWTQVASEANVCDVLIPLKAGGTEKRYTVNGWIDTQSGADSIRDALVLAVAGKMAVNHDGQYFKVIAGSYRAPVFEIDESWTAGPIDYDTLTDDSSAVNEVRGVFVSEVHGWKPVEFPAIVADESRDGPLIEFELPFTKSNAMAQRIARIVQRRSALQRRLLIPLNLRGIGLDSMETGTVQHPAMESVSNYVFEIQRWSIAQDFAVTIELGEESSEVYDWTAATDEQDLSVPDYDLTQPDASTVGAGSVAAPSVAVVSSTQLDVTVTVPLIAAYILYRDTVATFDYLTAVVVVNDYGTPASSVLINDTGLTPSTTYYYWLLAYNVYIGTSVLSASDSATTPA